MLDSISRIHVSWSSEQQNGDHKYPANCYDYSPTPSYSVSPSPPCILLYFRGDDTNLVGRYIIGPLFGLFSVHLDDTCLGGRSVTTQAGIASVDRVVVLRVFERRHGFRCSVVVAGQAIPLSPPSGGNIGRCKCGCGVANETILVTMSLMVIRQESCSVRACAVAMRATPLAHMGDNGR